MRYAILGVGNIGRVNTKALLDVEGVEIAACANRTAEKAEQMCRELGLDCPVYSDWREALKKEKPDAAVICVFNDQHKEYFMECVRLGINVLIEKPLANTYEDCLEMIRAAKEAGIKVTVLQTQRYGAVLETAKQYIRDHREELGELCQITDDLSCNYFWEGRSPWHLDDTRSGGGIVFNYGVHQLDRVHFFMEESTRDFHAIYRRKKQGIETYSSYAMMGVGDRGTPYTIACTGYCGPWNSTLSLYYQNQTIRCELWDNGHVERGVYVGDTSTDIYRKIDLTCQDGEASHEMYVRQMQEADDYLNGRRPDAPVSMEWAAELVRLCELGREQQKRKSPTLKEASCPESR